MTRRLVLVGGGAGTGKSTAAKQLARCLGASWFEIDLLWTALRDAASPGSPAREVLDVDARLRAGPASAGVLLARHVAASEVVCAALPGALAHELTAHPVVVADGAWLLPAWVARLTMDEVVVSSVFLLEPEPARLRVALDTRRAAPAADWHDESHRSAVVHGSWLAEEARSHGLPVVKSRP